MRAAAGSEIEILDVDEAKFVALRGRQFAQAELPCFLAGDVADVDGTILEDDFVGQALGGFDLLFGQRRRVQIDGAVVLGHVEGDGWNVKQTDEGGREHVLAGVLLHVIAAARRVNLATDERSGLQGSLVEIALCFDIVDHFAVFCVSDFGDAELGGARREPSRIVNLASAGGIEGGAIENERRAGRVNDLAHFGLEVVDEGIVIVEAIGHSERPF